ncbi:MAG: hypothetical protein GY910_05360, partial [bacterium]|nr:hypothetical protein [bacterium]
LDIRAVHLHDAPSRVEHQEAPAPVRLFFYANRIPALITREAPDTVGGILGAHTHDGDRRHGLCSVPLIKLFKGIAVRRLHGPPAPSNKRAFHGPELRIKRDLATRRCRLADKMLDRASVEIERKRDAALFFTRPEAGQRCHELAGGRLGIGSILSAESVEEAPGPDIRPAMAGDGDLFQVLPLRIALVDELEARELFVAGGIKRIQRIAILAPAREPPQIIVLDAEQSPVRVEVAGSHTQI